MNGDLARAEKYACEHDSGVRDDIRELFRTRRKSTGLKAP